MNESSPGQTPKTNELDHAIKHFGKPLEPAQKQRLMGKLREEKMRLLSRHRGLSRQTKRGRSR